DSANGNCTTTGSLNGVRRVHTATLLLNGKVLVAGGDTGSIYLATAELYDSATGSWSGTGNLITARSGHTATVFSNGKVLVVGGVNSQNWLSSAELYDPASGTWMATGNMATARYFLTSTLLSNGKVLVAGGFNGIDRLVSTELYDPGTRTWAATGNLHTKRMAHTATLLSNGKVLVAGGNSGANILASVELYDPATATWAVTASLATARFNHTATLLTDGKVLVTGGGDYLSSFSSAELYDVGLGFSSLSQPKINTVTSPLRPGTSLTLTGSQFKSISSASEGNSQDSATNYPLVQLRRLDSDQVTFLNSKGNWSNTRFQSTAVSGFLNGPALVTVFANGIPSKSAFLSIQLAPLKAVSRKTHGTAGNFDIALPLTGTKVGVECRKGGTSQNHTMIVTFPSAITVASTDVTLDPAALNPTGSISSFSVSGKIATVNLTAVSNAQTLRVNLRGVSDG